MTERRRLAALHGSEILAGRAETYRRLLVEALPFAVQRLAELKTRQHVSDEPSRLRAIQAEMASTAMIHGETVQETIARLWPERARFAERSAAA